MSLVKLLLKRMKYFFIPLKPSSLHPKYDFDYMNDKIWNDYSTTKYFLMEVYLKAHLRFNVSLNLK